MNKAGLIEAVVKSAKISNTDARNAVDAVFDTIVKTLKKNKNETVVVIGFGTFSVTRRSARAGRNPKTGEEIKIKAQNSPKFKPGKSFKDAVKK